MPYIGNQPAPTNITSADITDGTIANVDIASDAAIDITKLSTTVIPASGGTFTGDVSFGDNDKAIFGAGSDLEIYHDGAASYIEEKGTGSLYIKGTQLRMQATDGTTYLEANDGGAVTLKHSGTTVFNTTSSGINVTGKIIVAGGGSSTFDNVVEIRHDTNDTRILFNRTDTGSNAWVGIPSWDSDAFKIYGPTASGSEPAANYTNQGWSLYGGGSVRLATTSAGINVTGNVGLSGSVDFGDWTITESGGSLYFATGGTNKMKLDASGNLQVAGSVDANATIS